MSEANAQQHNVLSLESSYQALYTELHATGSRHNNIRTSPIARDRSSGSTARSRILGVLKLHESLLARRPRSETSDGVTYSYLKSTKLSGDRILLSGVSTPLSVGIILADLKSDALPYHVEWVGDSEDSYPPGRKLAPLIEHDWRFHTR
ncbi:hypothetical protein BDP27DRAFT_1363862 [Rhodocollybia butyracea]|uniref:Uncharacterized protein n=1 Tax=Rhodocollybia butyracea TaxID=206335 RepID=A0A9P5U797_9AGAR|nr:hypothetical protein BDP27DRAFT_1363862 [Rhodocollybia butyracea]